MAIRPASRAARRRIGSTRPHRVLVAVVAALLLAAGCTDTSSDAPDTTEAGATAAKAGSSTTVAAAIEGSGLGASGPAGRYVADGRPVAAVPAVGAVVPIRGWQAAGAVHWATATADRVIVGSGDDVAVTQVIAFDRAGNEVWRLEGSFSFTTPLDVGSALLVTMSGPDGDLGVSAVNPADGSIVWEDPDATIDLVSADAGILVSRNKAELGGRVLDLADGKELWRADAEPLAICGELVVASRSVKPASALDARTGLTVRDFEDPWAAATCLPDGGFIARTTAPEGDDIARVASDGTVAWRHRIEIDEVLDELTFTGTAVLLNSEGMLRGLDSETGDELWNSESTRVYRSVVIAPDRVFDGGVDGGVLTVLDTRSGTNLAGEATVGSATPVEDGWISIEGDALARHNAADGVIAWMSPAVAYGVWAIPGGFILDDHGDVFSYWS